MIVWIGIDDTDNLDSRGTGYIARSLANHILGPGWGKCMGITRHQLLVDPAIPYTSHNSSLCIQWETEMDTIERFIERSSRFLCDHSAEGSDPGLCVVMEDQINPSLQEFGQNAKTKVLSKQSAISLAHQYHCHLSEHGGTGGGVIGALAAVGLASGGNDGRYVWLQGIREMEGIFSHQEILQKSGVKNIQSLQGKAIPKEDLIEIGDWFRPVLLNHQPTLLVESSLHPFARWKILDRETIKARF